MINNGCKVNGRTCERETDGERERGREREKVKKETAYDGGAEGIWVYEGGAG